MKRAGKEAGQAARPPACLSGAVAFLDSASLEGPRGFGFKFFSASLHQPKPSLSLVKT
jgi:hypothetical protein